MNCPKCNGKTKVLDSKSNDEVVYRKRKCDNCGHIFYTEEYVALSADGFQEICKTYRQKLQKRRKKWKHIRLRCDTKPMKYRLRGERE